MAKKETTEVQIVTTNVSDVAQALRGYISVTSGQYKQKRKGRIDKRILDKSISEMRAEFDRFVDALLAA